ncbi:AAA family ATPase [Bradyrhizobium sp. AUGA SZCCT0177]|uniref:AAA family ATPase n=1 Tax=Bradyrhizobium sp. AUGA SZCCT0177 TaxID=2807665 RepID=UPI001BA56202|nr:AAA family ATPase [Bradyrhizobium sp. AUGA SZCCT0177]MBR1285380.1 AAA family ATPase [Bradyrhizobium sp. AUGA SZCCT0177]
MKLKKLALNNFRQFYGSREVILSTDGVRNVTVIHGENGAGKTSLLNAFKWCFYGGTDFDTGNEKLLNEHAITETTGDNRIKMSVEVEFDHEDMRYVASRSQEYRRVQGLQVEPAGGSVLELSWTDRSGKFDRAKNPESLISQILPEKMHSYFFFNGERIEKLAYASASHEIREAIKTLMGLEIVERAQVHLSDRVKKQLTKQIKQGASQELSRIIDQETELEDKKRRATEQIDIEDKNIEGFKEELGVVRNKLIALESTTKLQEEADSIDKRLLEIKDDVETINTKNRQLISERGFLAFFETASSDVLNLLEERRKKGELPYQIKQQFVEDLLNNGRCICGADLTNGSEAYRAVEHYRHAAAAAGVEEAFIATTGALKQIEWSRRDLFQSLREGLKRRSELLAERDQRTGRLDDINKLLEGSDQEDVVRLGKKRATLQNDVEEALGRRGRAVGDLEKCNTDLEAVVAIRKDLSARSAQVEVAKRRLELAEECARVIGELHESLSRLTKEQLSKRVNETFRKILQKDYWAEIDDNYALQIYKDVPNHGREIVYEKSTGESQVTSLSFIASIVNLAKERHGRDNQFFRGGVFPIVMDSPFGSLGETYRKLIARYIPELADQIILLVSPTQWKGDVEKECGSRVGKHVTLVYHSPKVGEGKESYFVRADSTYEYTEFEEGYHG